MGPQLTTDGGPSARVLALSSRTAEVLNAHPRTRDLAASLPQADTSPLRIALLGPYSAGKSMLIAALRRLPAAEVEKLVDAAPKTQEATPHPWNGVMLVDLPGTLSGNDEHSAAARRGVRSADALMIVTTSELPGEAETRAILQALEADGFADRSVVVVNKMSAENSDRDVILDEIRKRLGPFADCVPIVPTDARDYVDAANDRDLSAKQRELLASESGIDALTAELRRIIAPGVSGVRPKAQACELLRVLTDAEQLWELEGEELDAAQTAKKVEESVSRAKEGVLDALDRESEVVASRVRKAGNRAADSVSEKSGIVPVDIATAVIGELVDARTDFDVRFATSVRTAFDMLVAEYGGGVPEPEDWANDVDSPEVTLAAPTESPYEKAIREAAEKAAKMGAGRLHEWLKKVADSRERAADVANWLNKTRAGQKVLDAGGKITDGVGKFKPWGKGKAANRVAGAATKVQWAMAAMGPLSDLKSIAQDQNKRRAVDKRRQALRDHFADVALGQRTDLADAGEQYLGQWIAEVEHSLSDLTHPGAQISAARETALKEIRRLRDETEKLVGPATA
ncbi:50S ribosome-binding GTPase [Streptomyces europaeiscabiei]|uniref:50S ribosome-binding GTPase n=1 Tax=Streptomyces europaeiscabiei TaxID=146819 RepID=A0AAJ2ULP6_9ACTN|nr:GTPase [Streptomyces europaeiscabiei]MDX3130921.1 50S ribosome-binding GTPase [Streptomyces europaeiscabiei]